MGVFYIVLAYNTRYVYSEFTAWPALLTVHAAMGPAKNPRYVRAFWVSAPITARDPHALLPPQYHRAALAARLTRYRACRPLFRNIAFIDRFPN